MSIYKKLEYTANSIIDITNALAAKGFDMSQYALGDYAKLILMIDGSGGSGEGDSCPPINGVCDCLISRVINKDKIISINKIINCTKNIYLYNGETKNLNNIFTINFGIKNLQFVDICLYLKPYKFSKPFVSLCENVNLCEKETINLTKKINIIKNVNLTNKNVLYLKSYKFSKPKINLLKNIVLDNISVMYLTKKINIIKNVNLTNKIQIINTEETEENDKII